MKRYGLRTAQPTWRLAVVVALLLLPFPGCSDEPSVTGQSPAAAESTAAEKPPRSFDFVPLAAPGDVPGTEVRVVVQAASFQDVAAVHGIHHAFDNGASPKALMVESTGGGCGWLDYDRDGRPDLYLTQGGRPDVTPDQRAQADELYRQRVTGDFAECHTAAGIDERGFGHGVAAGDVNNDGFDDLFIANAGANSLFLNQGDGTFIRADQWLEGGRDVWSSSPAWGDIDRDGDLDLYVCNYAVYDPLNPVSCLDQDGIPSICHPRNVEPEPDEFFLNTGDGRLVERSREFGLYGEGNKALGVVIADFTADAWPDIYVANDTTANFLFVNNQGRRFTESALLLGGSFSATGATQASMGVAFGDYDGNLLPDVCLTHFTGEANTLYQNLGPQGLQDVSGRTGLRDLTLAKLGFGIVMNDFNGDRAPELMVANGHIDPRYEESEGYEMLPQLLTFDGAQWHDCSADAGAYFQRASVGRGVASADFDGDGWLDLCVVHHNSPTALLRNNGSDHHMLRIGCIGQRSNRSGIGVHIRVQSGDTVLAREIPGGTSYAASHESVADFGLGDRAGPCRVTVAWPSGTTDEFELETVDQSLIVQEGRGWTTLPRD